MLISGINSFYSRNYLQPFTHTRREVLDENGKRLYLTDTCFFRTDLAWDYFALFLNRKYKNVDDVNVIVHACSEGQEAYTLAAELDYLLGKNAKKFFPLHAKDIDNENIKRAKRGIYSIIRGEKDAFEFYLGNENINKYFRDIFVIPNAVEPNPKTIKNKVNFKQSNIFDDMGEISKPNTVLMFRNCTRYLSEAERKKLVNELAKNMAKSSLLVIGDDDKEECCFHIMLKNSGFIETSVENVYLPPRVIENADIEKCNLNNKCFDYMDVLSEYL